MAEVIPDQDPSLNADPSTKELAPPVSPEASDVGLNAGVPAPEEPIKDVLTNEVSADGEVINDALNKLNDEQLIATESRYHELSYLRDDLITQRGMTQTLAAEAISIKPGFGRGRPVSFYSKLPSATGYQAAIEEIDGAMAGDLVAQLQGQISRLTFIRDNPGVVVIMKELDFDLRCRSVSALWHSLKELRDLSTAVGFQWDDQTFSACISDPTQNATVPAVLNTDKALLYSFANMDEYYKAHLEAPAMIEIMTGYLREWTEAFSAFYNDTKDTGKAATPAIPKAPSVSFNGGKTTSVDNIADTFLAARDKIATEFEPLDSITLTRRLLDSLQQAKVADISSRYAGYCEEADKLIKVLTDIMNYLEGYSTSSENLTFVNDGVFKLIGAFSEVNNKLVAALGQISTWCGNAGLVSSYASAFMSGVAECAWECINKCKDTMQMTEMQYDTLKGYIDGMRETIASKTA